MIKLNSNFLKPFLLCSAFYAFIGCGSDSLTEADVVGLIERERQQVDSYVYELPNSYSFSSFIAGTASAEFNVSFYNEYQALSPDRIFVDVLNEDLTAIRGYDVWEPLPKTYINSSGEIVTLDYNYALTGASDEAFDIEVVMEHNGASTATIDADITDSRFFRAHVLSTEYGGK